jgi:Na+/phosphate symporter
MTFRLFSILLLVIGAILLLLTNSIWHKTLGGSVFILGFLMLGLDLMRAYIQKGEN